MTDRTANRLLLAILAVFILLAGWYSVTIPLGEGPDEVPHFTYVRYMARHGRIPTTTEEHEAFQPPLYYALGAMLTFWVEDRPDAPFAVRANANFDALDPRAPQNLLLHTAAEEWPYRGWALAWHLVRLLSIGLGAVTVWAIYRLGLVLFSEPSVGRPIALAMAALVAFIPQFIFMSAVINNDNAATTLSALVLWQTAALLSDADREGKGLRRCVVLGVLLGLGLLSKANLIALLPVVGLAIVIVQARRSSWSDRLHGLLVSGLIVLSLAALLSGWYFVRNWAQHGDPLGWAFVLQINAVRQGSLTWDLMVDLLKELFRSFWLSWVGVVFPGWIYWLIGAACLVGLFGFVVWLARCWRAFGSSLRATLLLLGLYTAITLGSWLKWTATVEATDQGRLLYPLLPVAALILVAGWAWWARGRARSWTLAGLSAGMLGLAIVTPVRFIAPVYAPAPIATEAELAAATSLGVRWGDVQLVGYRLESSEVRPGEKLVLHLYWQAEQPVGRDLMALIQLVDAEGIFLMYSDGSPTAGRDTTDRWLPGVPLASRHLLPIPDYGQPGDYRLTISLHPFGQQEWLTVRGTDGSVVGDHLVLPETIRIVK